MEPGPNSTQKEVLSRMPHGMVVGSLLFLVFINDLAHVVKTSEAWLIADDRLLYCHISNDKDSADLQTDLSALGLGNQVVPRLDHVLVVVDCNKYLGVNIGGDLSWDSHTKGGINPAQRCKVCVQQLH